MATVTTDDRIHRYASIIGVSTDDRIHRYAATQPVLTDERIHRWSDKSIDTGERIHRFASFRLITTDDRVFSYQADPPPTAESEGQSEFLFAIKGGSLSRKDGPKPTVSFSGEDGVSELDCDAATLVLTGRENTTSTMAINIRDKFFKYHPYGTGSHKDLMEHGAEVSALVEWGGQEQTFHATMRRPSVGEDSQGPRITWSGNGPSKKLFGGKKTLATLGGIGRPTGITNVGVLTEACNAVGIRSDWRGVNKTKVGGPYHRQKLTPAQITKQMLDLTLDNWTDDGDQIVGYDPEVARRLWDYTLGEDIVWKWDINPEDNEVYDKIVVLRAIATGKIFSTSTNVFFEVDEFGEYDVPLPGISGVYTKVEHAHFQGQFSDFIYDTQNGKIVRGAKGFWPSAWSGPIINATNCKLTWGAKTPEVTAAGVTRGDGAITFYGHLHRGGSTGEGDEEVGPSDYTTRYVAGDGDNELEFAPTPLLYDQAAMVYLANKALRRLGKPWVQHVFELPLNHLIKCGDWITIRGHSKLQALIGTFEVVGYQHTVSRKATERKSQVTLRELLTLD